MVCHTFVVIFCEEQNHEQGGNWPQVTLLGGMKNDYFFLNHDKITAQINGHLSPSWFDLAWLEMSY